MPSRSRTAAACCAAFEVTNFRPHDTVSDATATAGVLLHLLRAAARRGWTDLGPAQPRRWCHHRQRRIGRRRSRKGGQSPPRAPGRASATRTVVLSPLATPAELDIWAASAVEFARLRCHLLDVKAAVALAHAPRCTKVSPSISSPGLRASSPVREPPPSVRSTCSAPRALTVQGRPFRRWQRHKAVVSRACPLHPDGGLCPDREAGWPCLVDVGHHPLVVTSVCTPDGHLPRARRIRVSSTRPEPPPVSPNGRPKAATIWPATRLDRRPQPGAGPRSLALRVQTSRRGRAPCCRLEAGSEQSADSFGVASARWVCAEE